MKDVERVVGDCGLYSGGQRTSARLPLTGAAVAGQGSGDFVWVGLQSPNATQLGRLAEEFGLPRLAVLDALATHQRPKAGLYGEVLLVAFKPVRYVDSQEVVDVADVVLFLSAHAVVSVRHGQSTVLGQVRQELDNGELDLARSEVGMSGPVAVLHRALDLAVDQYVEVVTAIDADIAEIEAQVFGQDEGDHAERIYMLKREVMEFRRAVVPLRDPLQRFADGAMPGVPAETGPGFRDVLDHLLRAIDGIERHDALLSDVLQANVARVSVRHSALAVRQNEDMRRISAWAAIALAPTAIAGVYGMNFVHMPELQWRYGYPAVLALIATTCVVLYRLFRRNNWL